MAASEVLPRSDRMALPSSVERAADKGQLDGTAPTPDGNSALWCDCHLLAAWEKQLIAA